MLRLTPAAFLVFRKSSTFLHQAARIAYRFDRDPPGRARRARPRSGTAGALQGAIWASNRVSGARESASPSIKTIMSDNATLSDIDFGRHLGRFWRSAVALSAALGYRCDDDFASIPSRSSRPAPPPGRGRAGRFARFRKARPCFSPARPFPRSIPWRNRTRRGPACSAAASP